MGRAWGAEFGRIARIGVLALAASGLGACSASEPFRAKTSQYSNQYNKRMIEEGELVPKGGGNDKIGRPYQQNGRTYYPAEEPHYRAEGIASWYGPDFHGRPTANGEIFDMHGLSAAHPTLPMPSYLRVTNLANGRSIIVRLNNRGPFAKDRLVDLSVGAAKALDFYARGLTRVRVEYVGRAPLAGSDDRMLMATLRHGSPAPAPSPVRIASAKSVLPQSGNENATGRERESATSLPALRPLTPETGTGRALQWISAIEQPDRMARSVVRAPTAPASGESSAAELGLLSGHGLY